ncbi:hypothetical protein JCM3775_004478 [Rhodotorula graminis]
MKFAQYLNSHAIDEWRRAYIQYRQLKKQIGRATDELVDIDDGGTGDVSSGDAGKSVPGAHAIAAERERAARVRESQFRQSGSAVPGAREPGGGAVHDLVDDDRDLERGGGSDHEARPVPVRSLSEHKADPAKAPTPAPTATSPLHSPGLSVMSSSAGERNSDDTNNSRQPIVRLEPHASRSSTKAAERDDSSTGLPHPFSRKPSSGRDAIAGRPADSRRKWREGFSGSMELDEVIDKCPLQSRRFFALLDRELERVCGFYADREAEASKRYEELSAQWRELAIHKKEFQAFKERELHPPAFVTSLFPKNQHISHIPGTQMVRRTLAHRKQQAKDAEEAEDGPPRRRRLSDEGDEERDGDAEGEGADADDEGVEVAKQVYRHRRPEEYTNARSKLKLATIEFYRLLGMLKSYRLLNRTGFSKALKKFEKATGIPCSAKYSEKVEKANFVASTRLDDLIRETETAFANVFERGDRKKALERLRDFGAKKHHHFSTWRAGLLMGASLPLVVEGIVLSFKASTRSEIPYWPALLQLFAACFIPVIFCLAFFLNLATWSKARINYVLIFELDVRNRLDYHQYLEIPALLWFILSLFFWASFSNFWPDQITPSAYPLAWLVVMLAIMLNPFPVFYASARWWMLRSFCRMITSGLVAVEFRDFFLGDEMNSLYYSVYNLGFLYCTYSHRWPDDVFSTCSTNSTWTTAVLSSLPPFFRLGQSIRRYIDSDGMYLHLLNGGKYLVTISYFTAYYSWRIHEHAGDNVPWRLALFIIFATCNTLYTSTWDIYMDWSLGHRDVKDRKHFLLRNELAYFKDSPWVYYFAAVANVLMRFQWVIYFSPHPSTPVQGFIIAVIEAARRIMWNTLRVEAEHVGNRDGYRVTREVGLPYVTASSPEAGGSTVDDTDDGDVRLGPQKRFFVALHALHRSISRNFQPVLDAVWSPPLIGLGRHQDPVERERTEVEEQEHEASRDQRRGGEKRLGRSRTGSASAARRRRRPHGLDDSSDPSETGETGDESASGYPKSPSIDARRRRAGAGARAERQSDGGEGSGGTGDLGESALTAPARRKVRMAATTTHDSEDEAGEMRQDESDPDEVDADRELEQGMHEVEAMAKAAEQRM